MSKDEIAQGMEDNEARFVQFAEGMKGDEDLGQDITMKGQPFHYSQKNNELL